LISLATAEEVRFSIYKLQEMPSSAVFARAGNIGAHETPFVPPLKFRLILSNSFPIPTVFENRYASGEIVHEGA
jgi:hypothetical protein